MTPQIKAVWPSGQPPSQVGQRRWHVAYEFCEVLAERLDLEASIATAVQLPVRSA